MKIYLIGEPSIRDSDGSLCSVPGHQTWAVLARLLKSNRPLARRELANEVFCNVEDPLGALRWCLASLRKALGTGTLQGDPIALNLPIRTYVDVWALDKGEVDESGPTKFLDGIEPTAGAEFETWLLIEREQVTSELFAQLRRASMRALSAGSITSALAYAKRAVSCRPLDEAGHVLLVKCLATSGDMEAANAHVNETESRILIETGVAPSPALRAAARRSIADTPQGVSKNASIDALIKAGKAAVAAGAADAGIDCLRRAAEDAGAVNDKNLLARALSELGTSLVHAVRGYDDEGSLSLQAAADIASDIGASEITANALCELGYVEAMAGRRPSAASYLGEAEDFGQNNDRSLANIHAFTGFNLVDWGKYEKGTAHFQQAVDLARTSENRRREIWALGLGAWGLLRSGRAEEAHNWIANCLSLCDDVGWLAFRPWAVALQAEAAIALHEGRNSLKGELEEALALSNQLGDPCWQAASARSLALFYADKKDHAEAAKWLAHARERCCSVTDLYAGLQVEIFADQIRLSQKRGDHAEAATLAREFLPLVARTHADRYLEFATSALVGGRFWAK